ncbi:hypothetical protein [Paraburkholderia fungorum]|uniref:hypothetical protein n=1 Tax=Paraburkholderia fungorum TaxID=134537 RepID=UPI0038B9108D
MTGVAVRVASTADARDETCARRCASCRYRAADRHSLEQSIPGLVVFGSGFGASVAGSRLCRLHDQFVSPDDACAQFERIPRH